MCQPRSRLPLALPIIVAPLLAGCGDAVRAADAAWTEFTRPDAPEHVFRAPAYAIKPAQEDRSPRHAAVVVAPVEAPPVGLASLPTASIIPSLARTVPLHDAPAQAAPPPVVHQAALPVEADAHGGARPTGNAHGKNEAAADGHDETEPQAPHWGYHGAGGPERWADLSPAFAACGSGQKQSPIDIEAAEPADLMPALVFHYEASALKLRNNGHTIQADAAPGSWVEIGGTRYDLRQFHLHGPSEHTIDGVAAPLEVHLVHENAHGQLAVIGVMVEPGVDDNATLNLMARHAPHEPGLRQMPETTLQPHALLPAERGYWRYVGSLTTPPCSEGVAWHVMRAPITAARATIAALAGIMPPHNARPVQPLNGRVLVQK